MQSEVLCPCAHSGDYTLWIYAHSTIVHVSYEHEPWSFNVLQSPSDGCTVHILCSRSLRKSTVWLLSQCVSLRAEYRSQFSCALYYQGPGADHKQISDYAYPMAGSNDPTSQQFNGLLPMSSGLSSQAMYLPSAAEYASGSNGRLHFGYQLGTQYLLKPNFLVALDVYSAPCFNFHELTPPG